MQNVQVQKARRMDMLGDVSEDTDAESDSAVSMCTNNAIIVDMHKEDKCYAHFTKISSNNKTTNRRKLRGMIPRRCIPKSLVFDEHNIGQFSGENNYKDEQTAETIDNIIRDSYFALIASSIGEEKRDTFKTSKRTDAINEKTEDLVNDTFLTSSSINSTKGKNTEINVQSSDTAKDNASCEEILTKGMTDGTEDKDDSNKIDVIESIDESDDHNIDDNKSIDEMAANMDDNNLSIEDKIIDISDDAYLDSHLGNTDMQGKDKSITSSHQCKECGEILKNSYHLNKHKRIHTGNERPYICQHCDKRFTENGQLKKHLRIHTGSKPFKCNICQKQFTQGHNLKRHILIHTGEQPFKCLVCNQSFTCASNTKRHIMLKHPKSIDFSGDNIETVLEDLMERKPYQKNTLEDPEFATILETNEEGSEGKRVKRKKGKQEHACLICYREFSRSSHLRDHMYIHTGERPFVCHLCGKRTTVRSALNKHLRVHSGDKPFKCKYCQKSFTNPSDRNTHEQVHAKEKAYQCGLCDAQYPKSYMLRRHMICSHSDGRPYKCEICGKGFKLMSYVNIHKKIHSEQRLRFKCDYCRKTYTLPSDLAKHMLTHIEQEKKK